MSTPSVPPGVMPVGVTGMAPQQVSVPDEPNELEKAAKFLAQLEPNTIPLPELHCIASIAVSAKRIADALVSINQTLHTGNLGQGNHLAGIKTACDNAASGIYQGVTAKAKALEDEVRRIRGY